MDMLEDIAKGMVYLHGRRVMHCDLKSSNILVNKKRYIIRLIVVGTLNFVILDYHKLNLKLEEITEG